MHENTGRTSKICVRSDQDRIDVKNDVNGREIMVSIRCSEKVIYGKFRSQGEIMWRVEVADIKGRGTYQRSLVEGGTDLNPPA